MARRVEMKLRGRLRRLFANLGLKVLALLVAAAVWSFIASGRAAYRELEAPVELKGVPEGITVEGPEPASVSLRVAGKGRDLFRVRREDFRVVINLADKEMGTHVFDLTPADVVYSGGGAVEVEEILSEKAVVVGLERRITKAVPVMVDFIGAPRTGYYLGLPAVEPPRATLYGSAAVLDKVRAVSVAVDAEGRETPFTAEVPIRAPAGITLVGGDEARVTVPVGPGERRTLTAIRVAARGPGAGAYELSPATVSVTLEGEPGRLAAPGPVTATVSPRGPGRCAVRVDVPDHVTLVAISPREVTATPARGPE
jgi:YbbR domain-containing protein